MYFFTQMVRDNDDDISMIPMATILPPIGFTGGKKEVSEIEKRFREPMRKLKTLQKEISSDTSAMRRRIKEHRNLFPQDTEFESNMYRNISSMVGTSLSAIKEEANMTKIVVDLEQKERKLMLDNTTAGMAIAGGGGSMKSMVAGMYMGGTSANSTPQQSMVPISLIAGNSSGVSESVIDSFTNSGPVETVIEDIVQKSEVVDSKLIKAAEEKKESVVVQQEEPTIEIDRVNAMGLDYNYALGNLKIKNKPTQEIVKYDATMDQYWVEQRDGDGRVIDDGRKRHIGSMGKLDLSDIKDGIVRDSMNNMFQVELASTENMPDFYKKQWQEFSN
ncbi:MAG: hypothetical protein ACRCZ9_11280 [Fusobacteriaceae bacterium]